ncbi:hypothetical protein BDV12DRAFT_177953 [Aspergillus spectabilis]
MGTVGRSPLLLIRSGCEILCHAPEPSAAKAYQDFWAINSMIGDGQLGAYYSPAPAV